MMHVFLLALAVMTLGFRTIAVAAAAAIIFRILTLAVGLGVFFYLLGYTQLHP